MLSASSSSTSDDYARLTCRPTCPAWQTSYEIAKTAQNGLTVLVHGTGNLSVALDRAYANGAIFDEDLHQLTHRLKEEPHRGQAISIRELGTTATAESYRSGSNVPSLEPNLCLDLNNSDEEAASFAPKGELKSIVLANSMSGNVIPARVEVVH